MTDHEAENGADRRRARIDVGLMRLCGRDLAIRADSIREVVPLPDTLHADFSGTGACSGTIVIRGRAIPVLDIAGHLGFARAPCATGVVVVLRDGDRLLGLIMDMVSGLARIAADEVQPLAGVADGRQPLVASGFLHGQSLFGLIDQAAIFTLPGVIHAVEVGKDERRTASARGAVVLVSVADTQLAIDTGFVVATVPGDTITPSPEPAGPWMGVVRYLDREVPVVDDLALLGLTGRAAEGARGAVVIVPLAGDQMLGLKIDRIRRILPLGFRSLHPLSSELGRQLPLFRGAVVDHEGRQSLMLDHDAVRECVVLRTIAALTRRTGRTVADRPGGTPAGGSQAYVVFRTDEGYGAASLASVKQIVPFPIDAAPARLAGSALCAIASYAGTPLPLFDSADAPVTADMAGRMVLVVESDGAFNGLVVEKLETVARTVPQPRPGTSQGQFIHTQVDGQSVAVTVCDLARQLRLLAGSAPPIR
jgi:purine-binding chemotaxis protein CheW